jgi:tetratricopeptide (TPR) repeat protein
MLTSFQSQDYLFMDSKTSRFERIEAVFHQALAVSGDARVELIDAQCGGDRKLAAEVRMLLAASAKEEQRTASLLSEREHGKASESAGKRIGPYVLDGLLGRGGMGAVYLAHRADGEFEQKVAIKLIDLPLATTTFRERFRQERQILAGLQHPYIARLLDGGVTDGGDPYLVMEFVDGVPIHRYCERENLSVPDLLKLFLQVCEAVQFAHQNFVVHRDLKPDNILIAADGTPRLLDFGTAKLLSPSFAAAGAGLTRDGYQSFTPQYASPEQVLGNQVTAASDTYSLGVLLYLLLTGTQPYELAELTTAEMLRAICNEPPRRPEPAAGLGKRIDADLDAILMKALRKEPAERYGTAEQLAADVRAWLDGMPVAARRGTFRYRAAKFIRRNRISVAGSALLAVSLLAGVVGVAWQANVANEERQRAEESAADLRQLSNSLLSELDEAIKELPGSTGAQKLLVTRVLEHLDRTAKNLHGDRQTQLGLVDAYTRLGNIQGNPYDQNLGDPTGALASLDKAIALAAPLMPEGSKDKDALRALALAQGSRSEILFGTAKTEDAIVSMREAVETYDRLIAAPDATPALICAASSAYGTLGDELGQTGTASLADSAAALKAYNKSVALHERALAIDPGFLRATRGLPADYIKIGNVEMETDPAQALKDYQNALQIIDTLPKTERDSLSVVRMRMIVRRKEANALVQLGEYSEAIALFAEIAPSYQRLVAADPQDLRALTDLQSVLYDEALCFDAAADPALTTAPFDRRRNLAAAGQLWAQLVSNTDKMLKQDPSNENWKSFLAEAQVRLGTIQTILQSPGDSATLEKKGLAVLKDMASKNQTSPKTLDQAANAFLTVEPASLREPQFAVVCAESEVSLSHRQTPFMLLTLAQAYRAAGQIDKSHATAKEGLALLPTLQPGSVKPRLRKLLEIQAQTVR